MNHFLDLWPIPAGELRSILDNAKSRKAARAGLPKGAADKDAPLSGHTLAMIFEKNSTRTRFSFDAAMRQLGGNVEPRRHPGLRTPRWRRQLAAGLQALAAADGRIGLDFEIVYGHAFRVAPRPRVTARTEVPLDDLRAMVRRGNRA